MSRDQNQRHLLFSVITLFAAWLAGSIAAPSITVAAEEQNVLPEKEAVAAKMAAVGKASEFCSLERPSQVQRYFVTCRDATRLDVSIADCCIPGDHWQVKVKSWDAKPNTAVATSPGPAGAFGVAARVYTYGGTQNNKELKAEVDCSYIHGVNVFPAGSTVQLVTDGSCAINVQNLGLRDEINRTP